MYQSQSSSTYQLESENQDLGKSRNVRFTSSVKSSFVMNLQLYWRYKINLVSELIEFLVITLVFAVFAFSLFFRGGYESLTSQDIMIFFMGAILIMTFNSTALFVPVQNIQRDIYNGTLEYLFFNPSSKYGYFVGSILADGFVKFVVVFIPALTIISFVIGIYTSPVIVADILAVSLIVLVNLISLGVLISLSAILWKQVNAIVGILNMLFQFLAGAFFPISAYPQPVQYIAYLMPHTWGYDLVRYFSFRGHWTTILPVELEIFVLLFFTILYLTLSIVLLKKTEKYAKRKGLHRI